MRRIAVMMAIALVVPALSGCASAEDLTLADIPEDARPSGWSLDEGQSDTGEVKAGPLTLAAFGKRVYRHSDQPQGAVAVVTVTDVPLAGVEDRIRDQFQTVLKDQGVEESNCRSGSAKVDGNDVEYELCDATVQQAGATVDGHTVKYTFKCSDQGTAVGFLGLAATEVQAGGAGASDASTWEDVAGSSWQDQVAGMATAVQCDGGG